MFPNLTIPSPVRRPKNRAKMCTCTCRSYCASYNPSTGLYEGGQLLTRGTRDNHRKDDELRAIEEQSTAPGTRHRFKKPAVVNPDPHPTGSHANYERKPYAEWIGLIEKEVDWYSSLPLASQTVPLVFANEPASNGEYVQPLSHEITHPNRGLYALKVGPHANATYLAMENRFCELLTFIRADSPPDIGDALINRLDEELIRMNHEKMLQWTQQRQQAHVKTGATLVNTGETQLPWRHILILKPTLPNRVSFQPPWTSESSFKSCVPCVTHNA